MTKQYDRIKSDGRSCINRDYASIDGFEAFFMLHHRAITEENLSCAFDIAVELAYRDGVIDKLRKEIDEWRGKLYDAQYQLNMRDQ